MRRIIPFALLALVAASACTKKPEAAGLPKATLLTPEGARVQHDWLYAFVRGPITIRQDALAIEALRIFQQRQIDDLVVVDEKNRPVGIIDSQDLPKLKMM